MSRILDEIAKKEFGKGKMMVSLEPIQHYSVTDQVYEVLKKRILSRQFRPGQRLNLDELEQQLGVSRTPLKDALNRLAMESLVEILPRKGTYVTTLTVEELKEVFEVRQVLELYAAKLSIHRITPAKLQEMHDLVTDLEILIDNNTYSDYQAFMAKDRDLHLLIVELAGNRKLLELYKSLNVHVQIARAFYVQIDKRVQDTHKEHRAILQAFEAKDWEALERTLNRHIEAIKGGILEHLDEDSVI